MKKYIIFLIVIVVALLFLTSCFEDLVPEEPDYTAKVAFINNSAKKTVCPIWDGFKYATLAPGQKTGYSEQNPGPHTLQWKNTNNKDLTSVGYPSLVAGSSYIYPYND